MSLPTLRRKIQVTHLSPNFRECTRIVEERIPLLKSDEILIQNRYLGINASDVNFTSGKYLPGVKAPFDCGFECKEDD